MKKPIACLIGVALALNSAGVIASSGNEYETLKFDYSKKAVAISDVVFGNEGEIVSVSIANQSKGTEFSKNNTPDIFDAYYLNDSGMIGEDIVFSDTLLSGRYNIFVNGSFGQRNFYTIYRNEEDDATKSLIERINSANSSDDIKAIVFEGSNREILGIDREDELGSKYLEDYCDISSDVRKALGSAFTSSSFYDVYQKFIACSMLKEGKTDAVFENYASFFATTYEDYMKNDEAFRKKLSSYLKNTELLTYSAGTVSFTDLEKAYSDTCLLTEIIQTKTWNELKTVITENIDALNLDTSDYDDIKDSLKYKVFTKMFDKKDQYKNLSDVKKSFEDISEDVNDSQKTDDKGSSGSSSSGKGSLPTFSADPGFVPNPSTPDVETKQMFSDIKGHYGENYILQMANKGVLNGYADGTFLPDASVTRAEFSKMIAVLFNINADGAEIIYDDVKSGDWYNEYVKLLSKAGIINGYDGKFNPGASITRQDAAVICHRVLEYYNIECSDETAFDDSDVVSDYAKDAVSHLASQGIIKGYNNMFSPHNTITRADSAIMLSRLFDLVSSK